MGIYHMISPFYIFSILNIHAELSFKK